MTRGAEISAQDGALELTIPGRGSRPLDAVEGVFRSGGLTLHFHRSGAGQVTGFTLDAGPVRGLVFKRTT